jgi:hypothetical protein
MRTRVCLAGNSIHYPAQLWPYLNWALSLRAAGCEIVWLESLEGSARSAALEVEIAALRERLRPHGLHEALTLVTREGGEVLPTPAGTQPLEAALDAELLIDLGYLPASLARRFARSVFVDLDPGQAQIWADAGDLDISGHDVYISIGEGVEAPGRPFPGAGVEWRYVPTPIALDAWAPAATLAPSSAAYTTISHWWESEDVEIDGRWVENSKRAGFEPFLTLPSLTEARLELALGGLDDEDERRMLESLGWRVRAAEEIVSTPETYREYVYRSRGEFTAVKPPYALLESGWLNDRTASYLAAGKPAIVQRTIAAGNSVLPDDEGLVRFATLSQAADALRAVESDYERHARSARRVAEEHFDGRRIAARVLEYALG